MSILLLFSHGTNLYIFPQEHSTALCCDARTQRMCAKSFAAWSEFGTPHDPFPLNSFPRQVAAQFVCLHVTQLPTGRPRPLRPLSPHNRRQRRSCHNVPKSSHSMTLAYWKTSSTHNFLPGCPVEGAASKAAPAQHNRTRAAQRGRISSIMYFHHTYHVVCELLNTKRPL